ncbi:MAG TPA: CinA family protein [Candidatus Limnocylindria bacterium]|jgi:PncC family amidohydrolase
MNPPSEADLARAGARLGTALRARTWSLATAESSTGGLIGQAITMTPGASDYYAGGVICYSNRAKEVVLGVPHALIAAHGAVSEEVAAALAQGAAHRFETDLGVSVTGIAGPDGGSEQKPLGTHYVSVVRRGHPARVEHHLFGHDRTGNRAAAALAVLELALDEVSAAA